MTETHVTLVQLVVLWPTINLDWPSALGCGDVKEKQEGLKLNRWEDLTGYLQGVVGQVSGGGWGQWKPLKSTSSLPLQAAELEAEEETHGSYKSSHKGERGSFATTLQ